MRNTRFKGEVEKIQLFDTDFWNVSLQKACDLLENEILIKTRFVYAAVKDIALTIRSKEDRFLNSFYKKADYIFVDGRGILYASWLLGKPLKEMVGGPGIYFEMLKRADKKKYRIYFLGSQRSIIIQAIVRINQRYRHLQIAGYHDGYFKLEESSQIVDEINNCKPDIVFVGISTPKREYFIDMNRSRFDSFLCIPVGGVLDNEARIRSYAPRILSYIGFEWLYRAMQEPNRLMKRYLYTHSKFLLLFSKELFRCIKFKSNLP